MSSTDFQNCLANLNREKLAHEIHNENIEFTSFSEGTHYYFLSKDSVAHLHDLTSDSFSPWNGESDIYENCRKTTKVHTRFVEQQATGFSFCLEPRCTMKLIINIHKNHHELKRIVAYIYNQENALLTDVLYCYISKGLVEKLSVRGNNLRIKPSLSATVASAMNFRTTSEASKLLLSKNVRVTKKTLSSISRSAPMHVKSNQGRKAPTDPYKLYDRCLKNEGGEEIITKPVIERLDNDKLGFRVIVAFPKAIKVFNKSLSTLNDIADHQCYISDVLQKDSVERKRLIDNLLYETDSSGALPVVGTSLMVDTTFNLSSGEYVTMIHGVSSLFKHESSSKNASLLLAYMLHSRKRVEDHRHFAAFMKKQFADRCVGKGVGCIIHDGEASFSVYDSLFPMAVPLRCDIHRMENMERALKAGKEETAMVKDFLFGKKETNPEGSILIDGVLNVLNREDYYIKMREYMTQCNDELRKWFVREQKSLFEYNSFTKKLMGAWPLQYLSTNIIEARNAHIKLMVFRKMRGEKLMEEILNFHREEMNERLLVVKGEKTRFVITGGKSIDDYKSLTPRETKEYLARYGLEDETIEDVIQDFPNRFIDDRKMGRQTFVKAVNAITVFYASNGVHFTEHGEDLAKVVLIENSLKCHSRHCSKTKAHTICYHGAAVYSKLDESAKKGILDNLEKARSQVTCLQMMRDQLNPIDGTKYRTRRGKTFSQNNYSRRITSINRTSMDNQEDQEEELLDSDFSDEAMELN